MKNILSIILFVLPQYLLFAQTCTISSDTDWVNSSTCSGTDNIIEITNGATLTFDDNSDTFVGTQINVTDGRLYIDASIQIDASILIDADGTLEINKTLSLGDGADSGTCPYAIQVNAGGSIDATGNQNSETITICGDQIANGQDSPPQCADPASNDCSTQDCCISVAGGNWEGPLGISEGGKTPTVTPLPVLLKHFYFSEKDQFVTAYWSTASELNNDYFTIEESIDGFEFEPVAQVEGKGTTYQQQFYSHTFSPYHKNTEVLYYRLKQTDFDGTFDYSHIVSVGGVESEGKMDIYPNPVKEGQFYLTNPGMVVRQVKVIDLSGKEVINEVYNGGNSSYQLPLTMPKVNAGIYQVMMIGDKGIESKKIYVE